MSLRFVRLACVALGTAALTPSIALAGPPWISIELPANPHNPATRGAFLLVHGFHHELALGSELRGQAVGIVDGKRRAIPLAFSRTGAAGVSALQRNWPETGTWVLAISIADQDTPATALVGVRDGEVRAVRVPHRTDGRWTIPVPVTDRDIDTLLRELDGERVAADAGETPHPGAVVAVLLALLVPAMTLRRRAAR